jgi:hypothetical protein
VTKLETHALISLPQNWPCHHLGPEFRQLSTGKKHTVRVNFFEKKIIFREKGDEIRAFDGSDENHFFHQILLRLPAKLPFSYFGIPLFSFFKILTLN